MKLIAGIDPGVTTGIAVVDISSDFYEVCSFRNVSAADVCRIISEKGEPLIVASDVRRLPATVRRVAASFGARTFRPSTNLTSADKQRIAAAAAYRTTHERDALSAALLAKRKFMPTFRKVDFALAGRNMLHLKDEVKELLIRGDAGNIDRALALLAPQRAAPAKKRRLLHGAVPVRLHNKIALLEAEIAALKRGNTLPEKTVRKQNEPALIRSLRRTVALLSEEKQQLVHALHATEQQRVLEKDYEILVPFSATCEARGRIVLVQGNASLRLLERMRPRAVVSEQQLDISVPVIRPEEIPAERFGDVLAVRRSAIDPLIERESFLRWLDRYKSRHEKESA